jgi:hypothetical protein
VSGPSPRPRMDNGVAMDDCVAGMAQALQEATVAVGVAATLVAGATLQKLVTLQKLIESAHPRQALAQRLEHHLLVVAAAGLGEPFDRRLNCAAQPLLTGHHADTSMRRERTRAIRRLAFDRNLPPSEALGRIRDAFRSYDEEGIA